MQSVPELAVKWSTECSRRGSAIRWRLPGKDRCADSLATPGNRGHTAPPGGTPHLHRRRSHPRRPARRPRPRRYVRESTGGRRRRDLAGAGEPAVGGARRRLPRPGRQPLAASANLWPPGRDRAAMDDHELTAAVTGGRGVAALDADAHGGRYLPATTAMPTCRASRSTAGPAGSWPGAGTLAHLSACRCRHRSNRFPSRTEHGRGTRPRGGLSRGRSRRLRSTLSRRPPGWVSVLANTADQAS
jgi:hypothetical protein